MKPASKQSSREHPLARPSSIERVASSLQTQGALASVAALDGGVLSTLLPVLATTLAAKRQEARIAATLEAMNADLLEHEDRLKTLTNSQFKFINECVIAALHSTEDTKLNYLRNAVSNATTTDFEDVEASILGRVIRDISAEELNFLIVAFRYDGISIAGSGLDLGARNLLAVEPMSRDALLVNGLTGLGLLQVGGGMFDDIGVISFTSAVAKLIAVVRT